MFELIEVLMNFFMKLFSMRRVAVNTTGNKRQKVDVLKLRIPSNSQQYKNQLHSSLNNMASPYKLSDIASAC